MQSCSANHRTLDKFGSETKRIQLVNSCFIKGQLNFTCVDIILDKEGVKLSLRTSCEFRLKCNNVYVQAKIILYKEHWADKEVDRGHGHN